jgi:hypothetical protein
MQAVLEGLRMRGTAAAVLLCTVLCGCLDSGKPKVDLAGVAAKADTLLTKAVKEVADGKQDDARKTVKEALSVVSQFKENASSEDPLWLIMCRRELVLKQMREDLTPKETEGEAKAEEGKEGAGKEAAGKEGGGKDGGKEGAAKPAGEKDGQAKKGEKAEGGKPAEAKGAGAKAEGDAGKVKAEGEKAEAPKAEGEKAEAPKAEGEKAEAPKAEGEKAPAFGPQKPEGGEGEKAPAKGENAPADGKDAIDPNAPPGV